MAVSQHDSGSQRDSSLQLAFTATHQKGSAAQPNPPASRSGGKGLYLNGDVLACACPECGAPMTVRLWLLTADCWRCHTSIELSREQEAEALRLLEQQESTPEKPAAGQSPTQEAQTSRSSPVRAQAPLASPAAKPKSKAPAKAKPPTKTQPPQRQPAQRAAQPRKSSQAEESKRREQRPAPAVRQQPAKKPAAAVPPPRQRGPEAPPRESESQVARDLRYDRLRENADLRGDWWHVLPACLASLIFHLIAMIILGLLTFASEEENRQIVLSVTVGPQHEEGGEPAEEEKNVNEFELPVDKPPETEEEREALVKAAQDAEQLQVEEGAKVSLPSLTRVKAELASDDPYRRMHAARDPRIRSEIVRREGGTTLTEAAVARALRWIAEHQNRDGSWSLHNSGKGKRYADAGHVRSDVGGTALALMAMLGTGQTHKVGRYKENVSRGLQFLLASQEDDGDLRDSRGNQGMYVQGQAAIVLCDAFKLTGDETLRAPAQKAIDFIVAAQYDDGGWRYKSREDVSAAAQRGLRGDTSVVGWQLMAMHSAKSAYLDVPKATGERAHRFLDSVQKDSEGGLYAYISGHRATPAMTAEGLLSRMYLGWDREQRGLKKGVTHLVENHLPSTHQKNIYYWYYGTQVMHHWGGEPWQKWNLAMRDVLVSTQQASGPEAGSWSPRGMPHGSTGGRLYVTALAACTLEVYYRYAPLYWQIELD